MNFKLTEEHQAVREAAKNFAESECKSGVIERDTHQKVGFEQLKKLGELGFMGMMVDPKYGGSGMDTLSYVMAIEEISKIDASISVAMSVNNSLVCWGLEKFANEEQKIKYLVPLAKGEKIGAFCLSEPEAGSDATSQRTTAIDKGDHYLINGAKTWTTLAQHADMIFCLVRTSQEDIPQKGISFILIDMKTPGIVVQPINTLDNTPIPNHEVNTVFFEDVKVPKENLIGEEGKGWTYAKYLLEFERGNAASPGLYSQLEKLKKRASVESLDGATLMSDTNFVQALAMLEIQINAMEATELKILGNLTAGQNVGPESSLLKARGSEIGQAITELAVEIAGYYALPFNNPGPALGHNEPPIGSWFANVSAPRYFNNRKTSIYAGSNEVQRNIMAKLVLGL